MDQSHQPALSEADRQALDALIDAGFQIDQLPEDQRDRGQRLAGVFGLLDYLPDPGEADEVCDRTLAAIAQARDNERAATRSTALSGAGGLAIRWPEAIAVAAMVIVSAVLALPMLSHQRATARQQACQANLGQVGLAFDRYAADHNGALPAVQARPGDVWWDTGSFNKDGSARSNSAHLFLLVRAGYVDPEQLACAGRPHRVKLTLRMKDWPNAQTVPFSYQNLFTTDRPKWHGKAVITVLADKNPLFTTGGQKQGVPDDAPSPNHEDLGGQNVLRSDGAVQFIELPVIDREEGKDNIWHAEGHREYTGTESPADPHDAFLVP